MDARGVFSPLQRPIRSGLPGGQTAECVIHGLQRIFTHIGFRPSFPVFDNGAGVGHKSASGVVESELFARFRTHTGFDAIFCNPYSGNEKAA